MLKAAVLGEFRYGPGDSPWYGATFDSSEQAVRAHGIAKQLHLTELPRLLETRRRTHRRHADAPVPVHRRAGRLSCACSPTSGTPSTGSCRSCSTVR